MGKEANLKKVSSYYFLGNIFNKGIAFLTVPIFTRLLSTSDYGIVNTYNSWITIIAMFVGFALHMGVRTAFVDYKEKIDDFMSTIIIFTLISGISLSLVVFIIFNFLITTVNPYLVILCIFQGIATAFIEDYSTYLMMQYRYKFRTMLMVVPNCISVVLSIFAIKYVLSFKLYLGRIVPTALTIIFFGLIICALVFRRGENKVNKEYLKYALSFSLPLILHGIALSILSQSDRTMITWLADSSQTGIYSVIYNFSMIATVITTSLEGIWVPWFYKQLMEKNSKDINIIAKDYINLMTYCLIGVIMVGPEVVKILASSSYWDGIKIIPPVVISNFIIFAYTLYVNIEHFHKKTKGITVNTVIAAITNIILNYLFIPKFGYVAAAFTTLVSYFVSFELHAFKSKKLETELYPIKYFVLPLAELCLATVLFYVFIDNMAIRWGVVLVFIIAMYVKEWKRIIVYFPKLDRNKR